VQQYNGVPPYRETHAYVARIITDYNRKKLAERKRQASQGIIRKTGSTGKADMIAQKSQPNSAGDE
jgi:hypothetical protein